MVSADLRLMSLLLAVPLLNLLVHMVVARISRRSSQQVAAVKSLVIGVLPFGLLLGMALKGGPDGPGLAVMVVYAFILYFCFSYTYFHFFNMSETARRIRILYELQRAGTLSTEEMSRLYTATDIISLRLKRLVAMGQLKLNDGRYSVSGKTLYLGALLILIWRKLLGFKRGEG